VAQSVRHLTVDLSSGLHLTVVGSSPKLSFILGVEPAKERKTERVQFMDITSAVLCNNHDCLARLAPGPFHDSKWKRCTH